ncbi:hypothetical protein Kisp01_08600 [Kineosporia sp. NBRC 101677]|nr:hypothetical protein Kisp01_08600 [Kineosporia sp. NBRC 101677]
MGSVLRTWVIAGILYLVVSGVFYALTARDARPDWVATLSALVTYAVVVGAPALLFRRSRGGTSLGSYLLAVVPVPLVLLALSIWLWADRDVTTGTITGRVLQWLAVLVCVAAAVWFLPARRRPAPQPYQ